MHDVSDRAGPDSAAGPRGIVAVPDTARVLGRMYDGIEFRCN
jgi:hypothetical protein